MTECERLVKDGIITPEFLKEEVRDGYRVSAQMKKVWAVELDLLRKFIELCEQNGLKYYVGDGTLLGAVRHGGFIPWDDDMDVWMPRNDYNKLLQIKNEDLEEPYFLQTTLTDNDYYCAFARLRNSNTTGVLVSKNNRCNNGIYVDIYPIDGQRENIILRKLSSFKVHIKNVKANAYTYNVNPSAVTRVLNKTLHLPFIKYNPEKVYKKVDKLCQKIKWEDTSRIGHIAFTERPYKKLYFEKKDFLETKKADFEFLKVNIPAGYDNILSSLYGDYMKFPKEEERGAWHDFTFDPDTPYNKK